MPSSIGRLVRAAHLAGAADERPRVHQPLGPSRASSGFSHAVVATPGRTVYLAGQIGIDDAGRVVGDDFATQFGVALENVVVALRAAGGEPDDIVSMTIYTTNLDGYRTALGETGAVWREHMGRHFPAVAMIGVSELVEPAAVVEVVAIAVVPGTL